ncbi:O-antigen ligase family protein [Hirschia litorea]|uniref:O-antigen ligase family protein n=1 Tax=Hirschia litorea TaxID=1199156 RepID=A0ABW2INZ6_9PROT
MTTASWDTSPLNEPRRKIAKIKLPAQAQNWEVAFVAIWFALTATLMPGLELLRYACLLTFICSSAYHWKYLLRFSRTLWFLLLFPAWVILSSMWSPSGQALRFGLMHAVDIIAILYIALRLSPQQIIKALFYGYLFVGFLVFMHLPELDRSYSSDAFSEKNMLGNRVFYLYAASLYILLDKKSHILERSLAGILVIPSFYSIFVVESTTNFILAIITTVVLCAVTFLWTKIRQIQSGRLIMIVFGTVMTLILALLLLSLTQSPIDIVLEALDKDTTLTGRTTLWEDARRLISQNPVIGLGAEGFWQIGRGDAESIMMDQGKEQGTRFSFHNSYLEIMVHLGILGLVFMLIPLTFIIYRVIKNWVSKQDLTASFFAVICCVTLLSSITESDLNNVFAINKVMLFLAGLNSISYRKAYIEKAP